MKTLNLMVMTALLLAAKPASALFDVSAFGGYTTVNMSDANSNIHQLHDSLSFLSTDSATYFSNGYYVGADASFSVLPFLKIGPRLEFVSANAQLDLGDGTEWTHLHYEPNLMMYELGVSNDFSLPLTGLSVQAGLWGGYGSVGGQFRSEDNIFGNRSTQLSGGGFVGEIAAQVRYKIIPLITVGLDLGYRLANITQVNSSTGTTFFGPSGSLKDGNGNDVGLDFSGLNLGGNISFNF